MSGMGARPWQAGRTPGRRAPECPVRVHDAAGRRPASRTTSCASDLRPLRPRRASRGRAAGGGWRERSRQPALRYGPAAAGDSGRSPAVHLRCLFSASRQAGLQIASEAAEPTPHKKARFREAGHQVRGGSPGSSPQGSGELSSASRTSWRDTGARLDVGAGERPAILSRAAARAAARRSTDQMTRRAEGSRHSGSVKAEFISIGVSPRSRSMAGSALASDATSRRLRRATMKFSTPPAILRNRRKPRPGRTRTRVVRANAGHDALRRSWLKRDLITEF